MPLSIKTKQVAGVTFIVGLSVALLSVWYISSLVGVWLEETRAQAQLLANAVIQRAFDAARSGTDPVEALRNDSGLSSILQASLYSDNVVYGAIVDVHGVAIAHSDPASVGQTIPAASDLTALLAAGPIAQVREIYSPGDKQFEYSKPLLLQTKTGTAEFGSVRIGVSTLFLRQKLYKEMRTPLLTSAAAILIALVVATLLAQVTLRPIHVIRSGLARLGRGELDVDVDLPDDSALGDLEDSFKAVSARLASDRSELAGQRATLESVVENLEDAVALFSPSGTLLFANPAMRPVFDNRSGPIDQLLPDTHPYRIAVEAALLTRESADPATVQVPGGGERLLLAHPVEDGDGMLLGVMIVARNLTYLTQVESTLSYSRKLAALSRLSAGIAHEVKNPLNATMIHLELLKMQLADAPGALEHVAVIAAQVRRLDDVVQGFLKFTRPEDLQLQAVALLPLVEELMPVITAEASKHHVDVRLEIPVDLPPASADPGLLQQAFLNLALNACQAMPNGGKLRIVGSRSSRNRVEVAFEDTGVGISPEDLGRIFDLYFTTKEAGSGIGLSLVYRTVQLHDGELDVESIPGRGTTFRVKLREAPVPARRQSRNTLFTDLPDDESLRPGRIISAS
jgi:signal transduction histidine kinase